uniref:Uncharacterized protein n=1 Tax=Helianthus annuus TaxID=4232 RepID=A0A251UKU0_HELAN
MGLKHNKTTDELNNEHQYIIFNLQPLLQEILLRSLISPSASTISSHRIRHRLLRPPEVGFRLERRGWNQVC